METAANTNNTNTATAMEGFVIGAMATDLDKALNAICVKPGSKGFVLFELTDKTETEKRTVERIVNGEKKTVEQKLVSNFFRLTTGSKDGVYATFCKCQFMPVRFEGGKTVPCQPGSVKVAGAKIILSAGELKAAVSGLAKVGQGLQIHVDLGNGKCVLKTPKNSGMALNLAIPVKEAETVKFLSELSPLTEMYASCDVPAYELSRISGNAKVCLAVDAKSDLSGIKDRIGFSFGQDVRYAVSSGYQYAVGAVRNAKVSLAMGSEEEKDAEGNTVKEAVPAPFIGINASYVESIAQVADSGAQVHLELRGDAGKASSLKCEVPNVGEYRFPLLDYGMNEKVYNVIMTMQDVEGFDIVFDRAEFQTAIDLLGLGEEKKLRFNILSDHEIGVGSFMNLSVVDGAVSDTLPESYNQIVMKGRVTNYEKISSEGAVPTRAFVVSTLKSIVNSLYLKEILDKDGKGTGEKEKVVLRFRNQVIYAGNVPKGCVFADSVYDYRGNEVKKAASGLCTDQKKAEDAIEDAGEEKKGKKNTKKAAGKEAAD